MVTQHLIPVIVHSNPLIRDGLLPYNGYYWERNHPPTFTDFPPYDLSHY